MNKNTIFWVGGSLVLLVGVGITLKMIFHPSEKRMAKQMWDIFDKADRLPDVSYDEFEKAVMSNEYRFNLLRLKALKNDEKTFVFQKYTFDTWTLKRV